MSQSQFVAKNDSVRLTGTTFGTLDLRKKHFIFTTTGSASATLPQGLYDGHEISLLLLVDAGDLVISGDFQASLVSATFADALDSLTLRWVSGNGWTTVVNVGAVALA
jgi:hypothetical protein